MISLQLPEGVVSHFTSAEIRGSELYDEEVALCNQYEANRQLDFNRGRYCAHQCLNYFGKRQAILRDKDGVPLWPSDIRGSISHTFGLAGAVVALTNEIDAVGLDIERVGRIDRDLWKVLFTEKEIDFLNNRSFDDQRQLSTLMFSAKEAFFKMQYPLTRKGMEFEDLEIEIVDKEVKIRAMGTLSDQFKIITDFTDIYVICLLLKTNI
ncbi:4'-phosphopantetheinyl transferase family protein [Marinoscillum pacificum]|uniref:4'-phosphopantetheinyl transferase family protein n=1 Tax=Marinoscillum pacificum TaxID=392723 RepID=UPI002157E59B|nr:4'-phosphopantetheinyl transferase superfamily protein [Marinoscillum pacificum]